VVLVFLDLFVNFIAKVFPSRPKVGLDSATDCFALFLIPSANPVIAQWGMGVRMLEALGLPISSSGGEGLAAYTAIASAAWLDLGRQFGSAGTTYFEQYLYLASRGNACSSAALINARTKIDQHYKDAVAQGKINPNTGFPAQVPCPKGTHKVGLNCRPCDYSPAVNPCCPPFQTFAGGKCQTTPCPQLGDYRDILAPYQCAPNPCCR